MNFISISKRIKNIKQTINTALIAAARKPNSVKLLCVSKYASLEKIREAIAAGERCFAENYLQGALEKIDALQAENLEWHFIGRIQRNKTRKIAENFAWVHSIDNVPVAQRLNAHREACKPLNVCIQVNIDLDPSKSGVMPQEVKKIATIIDQLPHLNLRGLMTVLQKHDKLEDDRQSYHRLKKLFLALQESGFKLDTLSMGMSNDFAVAIAEGATMVRIGSAIFNPQRENSDRR